MDALALAFQDAERGRLMAKASIGNKIGSELAVASNWISPAYALLSENAERYDHYKDWVYVCVNTIAKRCAGQALNLARPTKRSRRGAKAFNHPPNSKTFLDGLHVLDGHPFLDAVQSPNRVMVRWSLIFSTVASLLITGESHWWLADNGGSMEIWPLPSHWIRPADPMRSAWIIRPWYSAVEWTIPAEQVAYFNLPDPGNPFLSASPLAKQVHSVNADEAIQLAQDQIFRNGMFPGLAVIAGNPLDPTGDGPPPLLDQDQKTVILDALRKMYQGANRYGSAIILDAMIRDIKPLSNKPAEMGFQESAELIKKRIFQAFGVSPIIAGEVENVNYASSWAAHNLFAEQVINPLLELLSQCLTRWVVPVFSGGDAGLVAWFEPAVADDPDLRDKAWDAAFKGGALTINERRASLGLPPIPAGDVLQTPMAILPTDATKKQDTEPDDEPPDVEPDADDEGKPADSKPADDESTDEDDKGAADDS